MITSSDPEYRSTKRIVAGVARLRSPFDQLASWVGDTFGVRVLNVVYDPRGKDGLRRPRLRIILEQGTEVRSFLDDVGNYDAEKQAKIAQRFCELVETRELGLIGRLRDSIWPQFETKSLLVVFSAFAPLTREEADQAVSDVEVDELRARLNNPDLWKIVRAFGHVTFMFFTDEQAEKSERAGLRSRYAQEYFELLSQHDEHGYLNAEEYSVTFDSKENFDKNYQSSWFYYFR